jgi:1,4-dihydroxy-2-naphthoate octaprenyltransferase
MYIDWTVVVLAVFSLLGLCFALWNLRESYKDRESVAEAQRLGIGTRDGNESRCIQAQAVVRDSWLRLGLWFVYLAMVFTGSAMSLEAQDHYRALLATAAGGVLIVCWLLSVGINAVNTVNDYRARAHLRKRMATIRAAYGTRGGID